MNHFNNGNYFFTSTLSSTKDSDDFVIKLYSTGTDMTDLETLIPEKVIHNFDELISFFEELDEEEQDEKIESKETVMI
ncbi:MAG: hypothetical protein WAM95_10280 [Bacillus sp. (in: firmicutes)]